MKLLILGGTSEAAGLARALAEYPDVQVINSLAGRTATAPVLPGTVRMGGFGGAEGLARYLAETGINRVIDATHPFAARISAHAAEACAGLGLPRLRLERPQWPRQAGDHWVEVADMATAAARVAGLGRRAFLTVGIGEVAAFAAVTDVHFLVRLIAEQALPLCDYEVVTGKGPFSAEAERNLMRAHAIQTVVTKASGGAATYGKIAAARELGLPVLMVQRPTKPEGICVADVASAVAWAISPA
ncbi:MAG: cobalt-precorrin-6A reductase [Magnetospirillum sp.]|nr:cobalt-precorrin-6A reductase [Magnetospirillum sp.]